MTDEAIKKAEEELQVPSKTPKINRDIALTTSGTENTVASVLNKDENPLKGKENNPSSNSKESSDTTISKSGNDVEDKIKARAERFGGFQSDDAKKIARAARLFSSIDLMNPFI